MSTLEHSLIMLLLLTGLLSARPRLPLAVQAVIIGAVALALVAPIAPLDLPWNALAASVIPVLLWQTAQPVVNARRPIKIEEILLWLLIVAGIGSVLALTAELNLAGALLFGVLAASVAWRALEGDETQASYLGPFGPLALAFLLTEIDLLIEVRDVYALMLLGGAVIGVVLGYASVQIALRIPGGLKRNVWSIAQVYLAYGIGLIFGLSGVATALLSIAAYLVYGSRRGLWVSGSLQPRPFDYRPIFGAAVIALAFFGWQTHVSLTGPLLLEVGLGLAVVGTAVWLGRFLKSQAFSVERSFVKVLTQVGLLLVPALLLWPRQALLDPAPLALALVVAAAAMLGTQLAIAPALKLYQWLDEAGAEVERPDQIVGRLLVKDVMLREVVTAMPLTPLLEVARMLGERRLGCVPVVEADGRLVGIITESDLFLKQEHLRYTGQPYLALFKLPVTLEHLPLKYAELGAALAADDVMTRDVIWVKESTSLEHAIRLLMRYNLKRLPVLDADPDAAGKPIGLITRADIIRLFTADQATARSRPGHDQEANQA
jgi:CBS domain-containing protein